MVKSLTEGAKTKFKIIGGAQTSQLWRMKQELATTHTHLLTQNIFKQKNSQLRTYVQNPHAHLYFKGAHCK